MDSTVFAEAAPPSPGHEACEAQGIPGDLDARQVRLYESTIAATIELIAERGYEGMTVADIIERADVSRSFFYAHFGGVEDAFTTAYEMVIAQLGSRLFRAVEAKRLWPERVKAGLDAVARLFAESPEFVRLTMVEPAVVGPWAARRHQRCLERVFPLLDEGMEFAPREHEIPRHLAPMALGGAITVVVDGGPRTDCLEDLLGDVYYALLLPYIGPEEASVHSTIAYPGADG